VTLFLDEGSVSELLTMDDALQAVADGFRSRGQGRLENLPRSRLRHDSGSVRLTAAVDEDRGYFGVKVSSSAVFGSDAGRVLTLFEIASGRLCAVIQVFRLGALRTGAVSGVATDLLARPAAEVLAMVGTGRQALTQLEALRRVRPICRLRLFGRDATRRKRFAATARRDGLEVVECETVREAVHGAGVVVTATAAVDPVLLGEWLDPGVHVNAVGANDESRRELDSAVVARADLVVTDEPDQARYEAADLIHPVADGIIEWRDVRGLDEVIAHRGVGRQSADDITLFKSLGTAIGDVVLAARAYEAALDRGVGERIPDLTGRLS
jgi:ornithine cyclodeaminase/alanine dehydrogenase-like protein (mu-crystallin family)